METAGQAAVVWFLMRMLHPVLVVVMVQTVLVTSTPERGKELQQENLENRLVTCTLAAVALKNITEESALAEKVAVETEIATVLKTLAAVAVQTELVAQVSLLSASIRRQ